MYKSKPETFPFPCSTSSMSSTHTLKRKPLSYMDVIRCFNELESDLKDACQNLAQSTVQLLQGFDSIAVQLHSVDLQASMPPAKPQWKLIRREYLDLVRSARTNAGTCSARIKMFCSVILPLSVRPSAGHSSRSQREKHHVLQSFMTISAEQAAFSVELVEKAVNLNSMLCNFHTEILRATSQRASSGQRELQDLSQKILLLQKNVQKSVRISLSFAGCSRTFRLITCSGRQSSKTRLCRYPLTLDNGLSQISNQFQEFDGTQSAVAHAQYTTQISHRKSDVLSNARTAISDLVPHEILTIEATFSHLTAIWLRLQTDSSEIFNWVQTNREPPPSISAYLHGGYTVYSALANSLDAYVEAIDLQPYTNHS
ncbi:hypothetical protein C8R47DRAFT_963807 [Mycena vitilis]|nr:hypothetical protein C8R47DRAFT_963807 [Mycena vitilis]